MSKQKLLAKLLAISADAEVEKKGKAPSSVGGFAYQKIDDVEEALKPLFVKHKVCVYVDVEEATTAQTEQRGKTVWVAEVLLGVHFADVETGEEILLHTRGSGFDHSDKAIGKATSYALKNLYLAVFHLKGQPDNEETPTEGNGGGESSSPPPRREPSNRASSPRPIRGPDDAFGWGEKHKESKVRDIPGDYYKWVLQNARNLDDGTRATILAEGKRRQEEPPAEDLDREVAAEDVNQDAAAPSGDDDIPF